MHFEIQRSDTSVYKTNLSTRIKLVTYVRKTSHNMQGQEEEIYKNKTTKYCNAQMKENYMYEINRIKSRATLRENIKTCSD